MASVCACVFAAYLALSHQKPSGEAPPGSQAIPAVSPSSTVPIGTTTAPAAPPAAAIPPPPPPPPTGQETFYADPEQVARRFIEAYGSFDWRDSDPQTAVRARSRPWATARLNEFLDGGSSAAFLTQQRVAAQEVRTVEIVFIDPTEKPTATEVNFLVLTRPHMTSSDPNRPEPYEAFYELLVIRQGDKWLVDRILA